MAGENLVIELNASEDAEATGNIAEALVPLMADVGIQVNYPAHEGHGDERRQHSRHLGVAHVAQRPEPRRALQPH